MDLKEIVFIFPKADQMTANLNGFDPTITNDLIKKIADKTLGMHDVNYFLCDTLGNYGRLQNDIEQNNTKTTLMWKLVELYSNHPKP